MDTQEMLSIPNNLEELPDTVMTNFDHSIDEDTARKLCSSHCFSRHAALNFNGKVWFADGKFHEEVWVYRVPRKTFSADTLRDLMKLVNDEFGWD